MGLLDQLGGSLKGALKSVVAAEAPALLTAALAKTDLGSLQGLVDHLQQNGLGTQVNSWLSSGANLAVSPDQIKTALGDEHVQQLAAHFGVPIGAALQFLAQHLPATVDQASSGGALQQSS